jgi:hypothetical protein
MVFSIGICALCQQPARDRDESGRSLWHTVVQTSVADVKKGFPILDSARMPCRFGVLPQTRIDRLSVAKHQLRVQIGMGDGGMQREQSKRTSGRAAGSAANEFFNSRSE